jgi:NlpC/P60 family
MIVRRVLRAAILLTLGACASPPAPTVRSHVPDLAPGPRQLELPSMGRDVTETAREYLGYDYRYGGTGDGGFDCSGLVSTVFARHGLQLPRSSAEQYRWGQPVSRRDLREGDLVFFANSEGLVDHVGIWAGNGRFIHASSSRGVVEDSSSSTWFQDHFVGGRRVGIARHEDRSTRRSKPVGS